MKKLILLLLFIPLVSFGQDTIPATKILTQKEVKMNKMLELKKDYNTKDRYVVYPTKNIYTSLLLDTQTGKIWQIQIGIGDNSDRMRSVLSDITYSWDGKIGQYKLYATENMYNFIMVNTELGYTYQVQWNIDKDLRFVRRIW
tara:strand:- start:604 stop:1032 length:429 start_codon:yes stop_codon:yes gene_type:complete